MRFLNRSTIVHDLRETFERNAEFAEKLEGTRRILKALFAAVSDCVFLFSKDRLTTANGEAEKLLSIFGEESERLLSALRQTRALAREDFPVDLEFELKPGINLPLRVLQASSFSLDGDGNLLVTVENLTPIAALERECEIIAAGERRRIGRNLHDGLAQVLTSLSLQIKTLALSTENPATRAEIEALTQEANQCLEMGSALTRRLERETNEALNSRSRNYTQPGNP